jgi:hypothetical protein
LGAANVSWGYKDYVSFVDDYSRFCWIYLRKHKSDVEQVFSSFQTHVERLMNAKIGVGNTIVCIGSLSAPA